MTIRSMAMEGRRGVVVVLAAVVVASGWLLASADLATAATTVSTESALRAALADPTTTEIVLSNGIDLVDCTASGGDLKRAGTVVIDGSGFALRQTCPGQRVLESTSGALTLTNITITGGDLVGVDPALGGGVHAAGDLTITDSSIVDNTVNGFTALGGGVEAAGRIWVIRSHIDDNTASGGLGAFGAGIMGGRWSPITVTDSTVDRNVATLSQPTSRNAGVLGGGISLLATTDVGAAATGTAGEVDVIRSSVSENRAEPKATVYSFAFGGGIFAGTVKLEDSHVDRNELHPTSTGANALGVGGGVYGETVVTAASSSLDANVIAPQGPYETAEGGAGATDRGMITVTDSSAVGNQLLDTDASIVGDAHGGAFLASALSIVRSTVGGNHVSGNTTAYAGGLAADTATVDSSTISGNSVTSANEAYAGGAMIGGGEIRGSTVSGNTVSAPTAHGGGVVHRTVHAVGASDVDLVDSTVSGNRAAGTSSRAGGIEQLSGSGATHLEFATVAGNEAAQGANVAAPTGGAAIASALPLVSSTATVVADPHGGGADCGDITLTSSAFTHVTDTSCGTAAAADPQLGALADNGGPTATLLPAATSPLLDQVPSDACVVLVSIDQRGVTRPQGSGCDIGAVERRFAPVDAPNSAPAAAIAAPRFTG